ncbi:MAG TPA: c-type cytochrome, partial [Candidatus Eisenbacteria bacterium]|nr:c-type cytochrome [Candidatus Eisenbacteria bacterium]
KLATNSSETPKIRVEALKALAALKDQRLAFAVQLALADKNETLRKEGAKLQAQLNPRDASEALKETLEHGTIGEKQTALQILGTITNASTERVLSEWMDTLLAGKVPRELQLDVLEAAEKLASPVLKEKLQRFDLARPAGDPLRAFREAIAGGDAAEGKKIFFERPEASCVRCHKINGEGGEVGPDLTAVGAKQTREYILESLVFPNTRIAAGFETVLIATKGGASYAGIIKSENDQELELNSPEDGLLKLRKAEIQSRDKGLSAMPEELRQVLPKHDLRNLVEYLSSLK